MIELKVKTVYIVDSYKMVVEPNEKIRVRNTQCTSFRWRHLYARMDRMLNVRWVPKRIQNMLNFFTPFFFLLLVTPPNSNEDDCAWDPLLHILPHLHSSLSFSANVICMHLSIDHNLLCI